MTKILTPAEADQALHRWASAGIAVTLAFEVGNPVCCLTQRKGNLECPGPGLIIHRSNETSTTVWPRRFGEILFWEEGDWQLLRFSRPQGFEGCEIIFIADYSGQLDADTIVMLTQVADRQASAQQRISKV